MSLGVVVVMLVALQRAAELALAARNTRRLRAAGAVEHGAGHYELIVALHAAWLAACAALAAAADGASTPLLLAYLALQPLRVWVLWSLGPRWTTRVLVPPGAPLVEGGPYRWFAHPNYALVAIEVPLLPLALGSWPLALAFGLANAALLRVRIRVEEAALGRGGV